MKEIKTIKEVQNVVLDILSYLDDVCGRYGLKYFVSDGTLLGAIRHKGFIPWDDDVDVWMPREDYDRLEQIVNEQEQGSYQVMNFKNTSYYVYGFAKLVDTRTRLIEDSGCSGTMGIYVDLFPYDGLPGEKPEDFEKHAKYCLFLESQRGPAFRTYRQFLQMKGSNRSLNKFLRWAIRRITGGRRILKVLDKNCRKYPVKGSRYVGCLCAGYKLHQMMPVSVTENLIRVPFEDRTVNATAEYDTYLTKLYGDYMQLPPEEERISHHHFQAWWLDEQQEEKACRK